MTAADDIAYGGTRKERAVLLARVTEALREGQTLEAAASAAGFSSTMHAKLMVRACRHDLPAEALKFDELLARQVQASVQTRADALVAELQGNKHLAALVSARFDQWAL